MVWAWVIPYFGLTGAFLAKFNRYMSPILPFVLLFAAGMILWLWKLGDRRRLRLPVRLPAALLALIAVGGALFWSLTLVNGVYAREHTWITASRWVYANASPGSVILWESWDDPLPKSIPGEPGMDMGSHGLRHIDWSPYEEDTEEKYAILRQKLQEADYVIYSSKRIYESVDELPQRYPMTIRYYELMFGERLGFAHAADFTSPPQLLGYTFPDHEADESWSLYDHPRVSIFAKQTELNETDYDCAPVRLVGRGNPLASRRRSAAVTSAERFGAGQRAGKRAARPGKHCIRAAAGSGDTLRRSTGRPRAGRKTASHRCCWQRPWISCRWSTTTGGTGLPAKTPGLPPPGGGW